jgi:hypothetical protein
MPASPRNHGMSRRFFPQQHGKQGQSMMSTTGFSGDGERSSSQVLISSDRVEGTNVYDQAGNHLGSIESLMITKVEGKVAYAVLSFGGFLGLGSEHYPVPWSGLSYSEERGGYVTSLTEAELRGAPRYGAEAGADWTDATWRGSVDRHYGGGGTGLGEASLTGPRVHR